MDRETCSTPLTVHGTASPKSPSRSLTASPVDDKTSVLTTTDRASPEPNCAICLGKLQNKSFTNSCLHQYCFTCLLEWSKVKAECPLCKQGFQSIIHNVRSIEDYDQYDLLPNEATAAATAAATVAATAAATAAYHWTMRDMPRFRYRTTMTGNNGRYRIEEMSPIALQPLPPARRPQRAPWTRSRRQIATAEFRRSIYERNLWVIPLHDITGRYRECSPEFYRNNPAQLHRLLPWLSRELTVLIENQSRLALVLDCLLNMLQYHSINSSSIRNYLRNNINPRHVDHFTHELWTFARSPYDMIGFDETAEYGSYEAHTIELPPSPHSVRDDDSDVVVISSDDSVDSSPETVANEEDNDIDVEGIGETSHLSSISSRSGRHGNNSRNTSHRLQAGESSHNHLLTANVRLQTSDLVSSSDSEDCVIVGYVKPLHERTPDIVDLDTDDDVIAEPSCETVARTSTDKVNNNDSNEQHSLDTGSPVASTSGSQDVPDSTAGCSNYIPSSVKNSHVHQQKEDKVRSSRSRVRVNKKPARVKSSHSSSSSPFSPVGKNHSKQLIYSSSDSLSSSPIRRHKSKGKRLKKSPYSSDSSSGSSRKCHKARVSNLSKLSCSSDSLSRSPVRHHLSKEKEDSRYTSNSGRSSLDDYSYPLASRISTYNSPYSSDDESIFGDEHKPKLRSIVIPKLTSTSHSKNVSYPTTTTSSSASSSSCRQREVTLNPWNLSSRDNKSKHKPRRHEKKKRRRKERYSSSSSSEDFVVHHTKRKSENAIIYSDSN